MSDDKKKEKVLMVLRKSRKAFLIEYGCGTLLLLLLGILALKGVQLKPIFSKTIFSLAMVSMLYGEYERINNQYKITDEKIVHTKGIIKQEKKNVYFAPLGFLPNINSHQSYLQRFLQYGSISISGIPGTGGRQTSFEIKDINNPQRILKVMEEWIDYHRNKSHGLEADVPEHN
jgi:hypothetical protein